VPSRLKAGSSGILMGAGRFTRDVRFRSGQRSSWPVLTADIRLKLPDSYARARDAGPTAQVPNPPRWMRGRSCAVRIVQQRMRSRLSRASGRNSTVTRCCVSNAIRSGWPIELSREAVSHGPVISKSTVYKYLQHTPYGSIPYVTEYTLRAARVVAVPGVTLSG